MKFNAPPVFLDEILTANRFTDTDWMIAYRDRYPNGCWVTISADARRYICTQTHEYTHFEKNKIKMQWEGFEHRRSDMDLGVLSPSRT